MMWRRISFFAAWTFLCFVLFALSAAFTQMGDCFDVQRCWSFKRRAMTFILIGGPALWFAGCLFIFRRWSR
jgi:hypothetical protein